MLLLSKYEPGNPNEHFTLKIQSPWSAEKFCKYQFPEWAFIAMSEFCLLGYIGKAASHFQPRAFPEMSFSPDSMSAWYVLEYPSQVRFNARVAVVAADTIEMELTLANQADRFFPGIDFHACLNLSPMGEEFADVNHSLKVFMSSGGLSSFHDLHWADGRPLTEDEKRYAKMSVKGSAGVYEKVWSNGTWKEYDKLILEKSSLPVIARKSACANRFVAVFWPRARYVMSNSDLACIHADPIIPNCPGRDEVSLHGRIIFHEGDVQSLFERTEKELAELSLKDKVWTQWHV